MTTTHQPELPAPSVIGAYYVAADMIAYGDAREAAALSRSERESLLEIISEGIRNAKRHPRQQYGLNLTTLRALEQALTQPLEVSGDQVVLVGYKNEAGEDCSAFLTASRIGQLLALTQQRGECVAIVDEARLRERAKSWRWDADNEDGLTAGYRKAMRDLSGELISLLDSSKGPIIKQSNTTPQPSAESLRDGIAALAKRWRAEAVKLREQAGRAKKREEAGYHPPISHVELHNAAQDADAYADELESLLAGGGGK